MRLIPLLVLVCVNANSVCAQSTLTEKLRKQEKSKGTVIITQSEQIEQIINNTVPNHTQQHTGNKDTTAAEHIHSTSKPSEDIKSNTKRELTLPVEDIKHAGTESAFLQVEIRVRIKPKPYKWVKNVATNFQSYQSIQVL